MICDDDKLSRPLNGKYYFNQEQLVQTNVIYKEEQIDYEDNIICTAVVVKDVDSVISLFKDLGFEMHHNMQNIEGRDIDGSSVRIYDSGSSAYQKS